MSESSISHIRAEGAPPLLIRADAGGTLGTGHVMRMLALAQAWMAQDGTVYMALLTCPVPLLERLWNEGIHIISLNQGLRGSDDDAGQLIQSARNRGAEWIVLDGYDFDLDYQRLIKNAGFKLMVMDDYGYSPTWCTDLILNQNLGAETRTYDNEVSDGRTLLGPNYVLLRKEFWDTATKATPPGTPIQKLLITLGGVDADNITSKVLNALEQAAPHNLHLRVILGPGNPHLKNLEALATNSRHEIEFLQNVTDMPAQYLWADGVVSAGGSSVYEWTALGLTGFILMIAENQREFCEALQSNGHPYVTEYLNKPSPLAITQGLRSFLKDESSPHNPHREKSFEIDTSGALRVVSEMNKVRPRI